MDCSDFLDRYSDYDDSLLTPAEEAVFRRHLDECAACARYDRVLRKGRMLARQVAAQPKADFVPRLQHRLFSDPRPPMAPGPVAAGGFLTLMLAAVAGLWLFDGGGPVAVRAPGLASGDLHVHRPEAVNRPTSLPHLGAVRLADWTAGRVDRRGASSYSPLVVGPPAYRGPGSATTGLPSGTGRALE